MLAKTRTGGWSPRVHRLSQVHRLVIRPLVFGLVLIAAGCSVQVSNAMVTGVGAEGQLITGAQPRQIDVLFVGNSYTYYNDMPEMVEAIAASNGADIESTVFATGGYYLRDHVSDGEVVAALGSGDYDVVVFQEQSLAPSLLRDMRENSLPAAGELSSAANSAGVRIVWYQTWGREDGSPDHGFQTYDQMQQALVSGYRQFADLSGGEVAGVGESWQRLRRSGAVIDLFDADGSHPSPAGSYASAVEITETILQMEISVAPSVDGIDDEMAAAVVAFG